MESPINDYIITKAFMPRLSKHILLMRERDNWDNLLNEFPNDPLVKKYKSNPIKWILEKYFLRFYKVEFVTQNFANMELVIGLKYDNERNSKIYLNPEIRIPFYPALEEIENQGIIWC